MPILKLHLENIGPFDKLELDLTDRKGKAHLGPHILAGVNGSGKTTVLRAIAWCLAGYDKESGFDHREWRAFLNGRKTSLAELDVGGKLAIVATPAYSAQPTEGAPLGCVAAYAPFQALKWLERPPTGIDEGPRKNWLSFRGSVSNEDVQAFWVSSFSRESLAKTKGQKNGRAAENVAGLRAAVRAILGDESVPNVNIDGPFVQPVLQFLGNELNFSQLPAGFNATMGWVVDYLLRQTVFAWKTGQAATRPGVILIDEIETHLHPRWQRRVLDGIRAAFPNTQIIVTSHSPFVISSCPEARVHILKLDEKGKAYLDQSIDAPAGASLTANIKDIFEVSSEFGPKVENELDSWNELKRKQAARKLSSEETKRLKTLVKSLAEQGEELAFIVSDPPVLPDSVVNELVAAVSKRR